MVLINNLTIDEINAALLHLQRSQGEVVGGIKENTIQNISITNTSTGVDYSTQIERLEKNVENLQRVDEELKDKDREIIEKLDALGLIGIGIDNLDFDPTTRVLSIFTTNGEEYTTTLPSEEVSLTFDSTSNKLVFSMGEQTKEVTLPYINASEKGAANGVATLDATGRVPYSQLPESAMEFKGEWNADTNTPTLKDGTGTNGDFYICNVGGTANFGTSQNPRKITFYVNDRVIYQGNVAQWKRLPASEVRTVNGQSGDVTLNGTNVKYSDANNSPTLKDKIDTVEDYAKTQSDWGQTNTSAIDFIKNKPSLATVATSGSYNDLSNKPTIPAAQIQSDWTQTDSTKKDFIKNKIPIWITSGSADDNMTPIDSVIAGSTRPITSGGVSSAINYPLILKFSNYTGSNKIIHLGTFNSSYANRTRCNIWAEARRADGSYRIMASVYQGYIKKGVSDNNAGYFDLYLYKTNDYIFDLYLFIGSYIDTVYVNLTDYAEFTYDGTEVTSYTGNFTNPRYDKPLQLFNISNNSANTVYWKITGLIPQGLGESVYLLQARAGELIVLSCGHGDNTVIVTPKAKRLLDTYSKISGISYNGQTLYLRISAYSHECILTMIAGTWIQPVNAQTTTQAEYNSATPITIET